MYYVYDGRVFDDRDDLNDYRDDNPGGTTQRFNTKAEANAFLGGMLTGSKPAPTKQPAPTQTGPVGTPSSPPKQMPGESGPFDPNAPVPTPAPAPAPQQTGPVGTPSSDPTKTQPGETGPFDPNAEPPAPAPQQTGPIGIPDSDPTKRQPGETGPIGFNDNAVEEVETAPTDTPTTTPVRQEEEAIYPYMYSTRDLGSGAQRESWQDQQVNFLTQSQLQIEFNQNSDLKRTFGDFNNYLSYMNGMLALAEDNPEIAWWDIGRLDSTTGETYDATSDPTSYYYGMEEEDMRSGSTALIDANQDRTNKIRAALEAMNALPEYQQLLQDHNVNFTFQNNDGDVFQFNGLNSVEIYEAAGIGIKEITQLGFVAALSILGTPALASSLTSTLGAAGANAAASSIINVATQLITTGEVDIRDALQAGATSVLAGAALDAIEESGIYDSLQEAVGGTTTDQLLDADGNIIGEVVRNSAGEVISSTGVSANEWYTYATELGGVIQEGQTVAEQLSTVLDVAPDWLYDAGFETAEAISSAFEEARSGISPTGTGEEAVVVPTTGDIFAGEETAEQEVAEEDILADTTQEATGLEASVIQDLFNDYMEEYRSEFEAQDALTVEQIQQVVASELAGLEQPETLTPEQIEQIVNNAISTIPEADTLTQEQVQEIVNSAVNAIEIPQGITTEDVTNIVNEAIAGIPAGTSPEQVQEIVNQAISGIVIPEGMTSEEVQQIVDTAVSGIQFPEGISEEDVDRIVSEAIGNIQFPEVDTLSNEEVQSIVNTAIGNITFPEGVTAEQVQEIVQQQLANIPEGLTQDQVSDIVSQAIAGIQFPEGITAQDVQGIVDQAIAGIQFPEIDTLSTDEVQNIVNTAISDIQFPEGVTAEQVLEIIQAQLEAQPEGLTSSDVTEIVSQAINGIEFPASVTQEEVTALIGEVQESLSGDLEAYQQSTAEQLEAAEEERAELGGQLGTLTDEVAGIAEDLINVGGNLEDLDERTQERLNELGLDLEDLSLLVNVNFEALQEGALTRESAMQELIEETAIRTEEQVAGLGEQVGGLMGGLEGLGQQVGGLEGALEGLGEGLGQLGLGTLGGLFGLGQQQQQLAQQQLAMLSKPEIRPFQKQEFKGLGYQRSPIQEIQQKPLSQQNLDKLIKGMLV